MSIWLIAVLAVLGFGFLLSLAPVELEVRAERRGALIIRIRILLMWGLARKTLVRVPGDDDPKKVDEEPAKKSKSKKRRPNFKRLYELGFHTRLIGLSISTISQIRVGDLNVETRYGTGDPQSTGMIAGMTSGVLATLQNKVHGDIAIAPDYMERVIEGEASGRVSVIPLTLVPGMVRFMFSPTTVRSIPALMGRGS